MDGLKETAFVVADAASPEGSIGQDLCTYPTIKPTISTRLQHENTVDALHNKLLSTALMCGCCGDRA